MFWFFLAEDSIFKSGWFNLDSDWNNKSSEYLIKPVLDIKDDLISFIYSENPVDFDVIIYASSQLYDVLKVCTIKFYTYLFN